MMINDKAMRVLGGPSQENKLANFYGVSPEDFDEIARERAAKLESDLDRIRGRERVCPTPQNAKARQVLGCDLSSSKLSQVLGISADEISQARRETAELHEEYIAQVREKKRFPDLKSTRKALQLLGFDPSRRKIQQFLGLSDEEFQQAEQDRLLRHEEYMTGLRQDEDISLRPVPRKAKKILGIRFSINDIDSGSSPSAEFLYLKYVLFSLLITIVMVFVWAKYFL
jgi:transcriptional regulator with XRE-family HTH domain